MKKMVTIKRQPATAVMADLRRWSTLCQRCNGDDSVDGNRAGVLPVGL